MKKIIILIILFLFFPILFLNFGRDASVYSYMGSLFFEGKIPYIDGWDHKGITIYLINALGYLIGFKSLIGIRILEIILILSTFLYSFKELSNKFSKKSVFVAVIFGLLTLKYFFDGGNLTEEYGALFTMVSAVILFKNKQNRYDLYIVGALFIVNLTIRANLISFWIALFLAYSMQLILKQKSVKEYLQSFLKMGIGAFFFCLFLAIYFIVTDSFTEFYKAAFTYNFSYSKSSFPKVIGYIISSSRTYTVSIVMILALLITIVKLLKKKSNLLILLLLFWVPIEFYFSNMSGKMYAHYYIMWFPIVVLSTILIINYFKIEFIKKEKEYILFIICLFFFFQIPIYSTLGSYKKIFDDKKSDSVLASEFINNNYKNKTILVWGNDPLIYNLTNKKAPVKNFYQTIFKLKSPHTKSMIKDFTNQIRLSLPDIIVDVKTPSLLFLDKENINAISIEQQNNLEPFISLVKENYILINKNFNYYFYSKKK
jgi:hypothetical protein